MTSKARFILVNTTKTTLGPPALIQYLHGRHIPADYIYAPKDSDKEYTDFELQALVEKVRTYPILGISSFAMSEPRCFQLAAAAKKANPAIHVVLGGPNVIMDPERILLDSAVDSVCIHEGELPLEALINTFGNGDATRVPGLWLKKSGSVIKNSFAPLIQDLDEIPFENYKASSFGRYWRLTSQGLTTESRLTEFIENPCMQGNFLYMMTTRGCPYSCSYCINATLNKMASCATGQRLRRQTCEFTIKSLCDVIADDKSVEKIFFFDDDFSLRSEDELYKFAQSYRTLVRLPFYIFANPNTTSDAKLDIYNEAGLASMELGVQTVSERVLKIYNREQNSEDLRRILTRTTEKGYDFQISFDIITNSPFEEPADVEQNILYILDLPGSFELYVHSLHLFPGSALYREHGGGTGNEVHEYQDNFSENPTRYYNEFYSKILFAMQGLHSVSNPELFGSLSRRQILEMLECPTECQSRLMAGLDARLGLTRVGRYYGDLHRI